MRNVWDSLEGIKFSSGNSRDLQRLMDEVEAISKRRRILRIAASSGILVSLLALVFFAGWQASYKFKSASKEITLITSEGSVGDYTLPDGSRVRLNSSSSLTYYNDFKGDTRLVSLSGEGFFEVSKNARKPFIVKMNDIEVKVLGTSFDAMSYPEDAFDRVILKSGHVAVSNADDQKVEMAPGQMLVYDKYNGSMTTEDIDADSACRWYETYLEFDGETLENVIRNISDRYRVNIDFRAGCCPVSSRMSMTIEREPLDKVLNVLCTLFPIRYEYHSDNHIVFIDKK